MASTLIGKAGGASIGQSLLARVSEHGSAAHAYCSVAALASGPYFARDYADFIHFLCMLHGRQPGVIDHAVTRASSPAEEAWLSEAASVFAGERAYLASLAAAVGPVPSTPGSADSDTAVLGQRHAIEMLARSERNGCALGAAVALLLDWCAIRLVLDDAARRFGADIPVHQGAEPKAVAAAVDRFADTPACRRATLFGAEQILVQHFGLWDLLEVRQQARAA